MSVCVCSCTHCNVNQIGQLVDAQSDSMTPSQPQADRSSWSFIHSLAQLGVPLMAEYEHIAAETFARVTRSFIGTRYESAMSCREMLASNAIRYFSMFPSTPYAVQCLNAAFNRRSGHTTVEHQYATRFSTSTSHTARGDTGRGVACDD